MPSELPDRLKGLEFDWYAVDIQGRIGLFATFGEGWVPSEVAKNPAAHEAISERLEAPSIGSEEVWADYARQGLYVFDWGESQFSYRRMAIPAQNASVTLLSRILEIDGLPRASFSFDAVQEVRNWS